MERAADWVFSHASELETGEMDTAQSTSEPIYHDGVGRKLLFRQTSFLVTQSCVLGYELIAFVSHMGTSTMCGHYVCHILKDGHWVIYNDNKVALSEVPPKELGYLYLYRRVETQEHC